MGKWSPSIKNLAPPQLGGLDPLFLPTQKLYNFAYLSFPINLSLCLLILAHAGAPQAPVSKENLWLHILLSLLPGQCQLPWKHALPLLNILPNSSSLLIPLHLASRQSSQWLLCRWPPCCQPKVHSSLLMSHSIRHSWLLPSLGHTPLLMSIHCSVLVFLLYLRLLQFRFLICWVISCSQPLWDGIPSGLMSGCLFFSLYSLFRWLQ